jgi:hypothetical protein
MRDEMGLILFDELVEITNQDFKTETTEPKQLIFVF